MPGSRARFHARMNQLFNEGSPPFAAPPSVLPLLRLSKALSEQSEGLFNPAPGSPDAGLGQGVRCRLHAPTRGRTLSTRSSGITRCVTSRSTVFACRHQTDRKAGFSSHTEGFAVDQATPVCRTWASTTRVSA